MHRVVDLSRSQISKFSGVFEGNCPSAPIRQRGDSAVGLVLRNQPLGGIHGELKGHQLEKTNRVQSDTPCPCQVATRAKKNDK